MLCAARAYNLKGHHSEMTSATLPKSVPVTHHYLGLFFAPTILFFAITGGLQMFGLHETARGTSFVFPNFLVHLKGIATPAVT
jgi:hypothetical protein